MRKRNSTMLRILLITGVALCGMALSGCVGGPRELSRKPGVLKRYCLSLEKDLIILPPAEDLEDSGSKRK